MKNTEGSALHKCSECEGGGKWLIATKMSKRKPTRKDSRTEFLDQRKYKLLQHRSLLESHGFACQVVHCTMCGGAGLIPEPAREKQMDLLNAMGGVTEDGGPLPPVGEINIDRKPLAGWHNG